MKKITYNNKQYVLNDPQYPVEETVTDTDMNEIKEVVNFNADETLEENIKIKEQLERTQSALINITTPKSSNINVKDSSDLNAKVDVYGSSSQKTRSGKNKFDVTKLNNVENIDSETSSFEVKKYGEWIMTEEDVSKLLKPNTQYKCIADVTLIESPQNVSEGIATLLALNSSSAGLNTILSCSSLTEKNAWQLSETKRLKSTFTTASDLSTFNMIHYGYHTSDWQVTGKFKFENIMILEATENDESFEQYGASPTPEYPSEIENVTGDINIKIYNKNLLDLTKCGFSNCVKNEDGSVRSNINNNYYATITTSQLNDFILQSKGKSLTFSFEGISTKTIGFFILCKRANSDSDYFETTKTGNSITMQIPEDLESLSYIQIRWNRQPTPFTDTTTVIDNIQLELNDTKTDFVKHEQQTITFPLQEGQRLYDGDYLADDGIHHVRKQIELNGTENWIKNVNYSTETILAVQLQTSDAVVSTSNTLCNFFKYNSDNTTANTYRFAGNYLLIKLDVSEFSTIEAFKTWLAEQKAAGTPVIVEYELAEEEIEPYTPEQQEAYNKLQNVLSYKTETNVFTDKAQLVFKYIADTKTYVDNQYNALANQVLELAGGN